MVSSFGYHDPMWTIHSRAGLDNPCGLLPTLNVHNLEIVVL